MCCSGEVEKAKVIIRDNSAHAHRALSLEFENLNSHFDFTTCLLWRVFSLSALHISFFICKTIGNVALELM